MKGSGSTILALLGILIVASLFVACSAGPEAATVTPTPDSNTPRPTGNLTAESCPPSGAVGLTGAGATFPQPLYQDWFSRWNELCGLEVNYQAIGSGGGIQQISARTVDFGASDAIMTDDEKASADGTIVHIPTTSDALAVIYNNNVIENLTLVLDGPTLADIFLGKITKWDDQKIKDLNPGVFLPADDLTVVHRSDGSGTTAIFTDYLSKVSQEWADEVGSATAVNWPVGLGGNGNSGVAGQVQQLPNTIGYVSLAFAKQNNISYVKMINSAGEIVEPSISSAEAASVGVELPDNMEVLLTDSPNEDAYPITGFTWLLVYREQDDRSKAQALGYVINWLLTDAQQFCEGLDYVPLSDEAQEKAIALLESVTYEGTSISQLE